MWGCGARGTAEKTTHLPPQASAPVASVESLRKTATLIHELADHFDEINSSQALVIEALLDSRTRRPHLKVEPQHQAAVVQVLSEVVPCALRQPGALPGTIRKAQSLVDHLSDGPWQQALLDEVKQLTLAATRASRESEMARESHRMAVQLAIGGAR